MNQTTQARKTSEYTVTIETDTLIAATALLEQIQSAARAGHLDWQDKSIRISMTFSDGLHSQTIAPLEAVIASQNNILGVDCSIQRKPVD
jgi:hypothetical protein